MAQPATTTELLDPTLVARARRYEREAIASLCDRNLDGLYRMCLALMGEPAAAEEVAGIALMKSLDGLRHFEGDASAYRVWLLRLGATACSRRRPQADGVRGAMARLSNFDYELVALRILGEVDIDRLGPVLNAQSANLRAWLVTGLREVDGRSGTGWGHDLRAFDAAVEEVIGGADPDKVAPRVAAPGDADRLLRTLAGLRELVGDPIPPAVATRLRTQLLAAVAEQRALWVHRHHAPATVPGIVRRRYPSRTGTFVAVATAGLVAIVVGGVVAVISSFAGPESSLYQVKRDTESILVTVNVDPVSRAQLELNLAQTREREAEDMASRGDGPRTADVLSDRFLLLRAASRDLISVPDHSARWRATRDRLFQEADVQMTPILRDLQLSRQTRSAQDVQNIVAGYETDAKQLDAELGRPQAQQNPSAPTPPPVVTAPSPT